MPNCRKKNTPTHSSDHLQHHPPNKVHGSFGGVACSEENIANQCNLTHRLCSKELSIGERGIRRLSRLPRDFKGEGFFLKLYIIRIMVFPLDDNFVFGDNFFSFGDNFFFAEGDKKNYSGKKNKLLTNKRSYSSNGNTITPMIVFFSVNPHVQHYLQLNFPGKK